MRAGWIWVVALGGTCVACATSDGKGSSEASALDADASVLDEGAIAGDAAVDSLDREGLDADAMGSDDDARVDVGSDGDGPAIGPAAQLSAGSLTTCALLTDGAVKCWGSNSTGAIGDGTTERRPRPTRSIGLPGAIEVRTSGHHTCAVTKDRSLWCWGGNTYGELGYAAAERCPTPCSLTPKRVAAISDVVQVGVRGGTCVLQGSGRVSCWGANYWGEAGDGTRDPRPRPVAVRGISDAAQIAVGSGYACALLTDRTVRCWGLNDDGQLGYESDDCVEVMPFRRSLCSLTPNRVSGLTDVTQIAAGAGFTCARLAMGAVQCWGNPSKGRRYTAVAEGALSGPLISAPKRG